MYVECSYTSVIYHLDGDCGPSECLSVKIFNQIKMIFRSGHVIWSPSACMVIVSQQPIHMARPTLYHSVQEHVAAACAA